jgi:hypothetical protein
MTMINKTTIWQHIMETMNAFSPYYREVAVYNLRQAEANHSWLPLLKSAVSAPAPVTADRLAASTPYIASHQRQAMLDCAMEQGLLVEEWPGGYRLTDQGKKVLSVFFDSAQAAIAGAPVLQQAEMEELAALLARIVMATERLPLPRSKDNFQSSRWTNPGPQAPATVRVEQYLTDLSHFRQDAHLASWQAYGVDGRSWEAFTCIWRNQASTPSDLASILSQRGYSEADYAEAIRLLLDKGWIEQALGRWQISANGRALRDVAEMVTDRLFFAGWRALNESELERLNELLVNLFHSLQETKLAPLPA